MSHHTMDNQFCTNTQGGEKMGESQVFTKLDRKPRIWVEESLEESRNSILFHLKL